MHWMDEPRMSWFTSGSYRKSYWLHLTMATNVPKRTVLLSVGLINLVYID